MMLSTVLIVVGFPAFHFLVCFTCFCLAIQCSLEKTNLNIQKHLNKYFLYCMIENKNKNVVNAELKTNIWSTQWETKGNNDKLLFKKEIRPWIYWTPKILK